MLSIGTSGSSANVRIDASPFPGNSVDMYLSSCWKFYLSLFYSINHPSFQMHGITYVLEVLGVDITPLLARGPSREMSSLQRTVSSHHALLLFLLDYILLLCARQDNISVPLDRTQAQVHVPRRIVDSLSLLLVNQAQ